MITDDQTRRLKDKLLLIFGFGKLYEIFKKVNIAPNHLSAVGFAFGCLSAPFLFSDWRVFVIFYFFYLLFDNLDGSFARYINQTNHSGETIDHAADSIIWIMIIIFAAVKQGEIWTVWVVAACVINTLMVFFWKIINDWRLRGIYLFFYIFGQNTLGLQVELVYVTITILARLGVNWWALRGSDSRPTA